MSDTRRSDAELAYLDDLTGLYNRRYLKAALPKELAKAKDQKSNLSLFMIDFDNFKSINDTYGHLNGDKVLIEISDILKKEIGKDGIFIRYAGDEFTVLLSGKPLKEAVSIGNKLLEAIAQHKLELKSGQKVPSFSFSVGVAAYPDDAASAESLIDKADQALYSAKRTGKNRLATVSDIISEARDRNLALFALPCKKLIGREKETEYLKSAYEAAHKGVKKYILIKGRDGVGKTRLITEVFNSDKISPRPLFLKCRKENMYQQYGAISAALDDHLDLLEARQVAGAIAPLNDIDKHILVSMIEKVKDLPITYSQPASPSKEDLNDKNIFHAIVSLIHELGLNRIVILIDDILWIDSGSLKVVRGILEGREFSGVLTVATVSRDALKADQAPGAPFLEFASASETPQPEVLDLEPLSETAVSELVKAIFPGLTIPSALEKKIYKTSGGYPSIAGEVVKYMLNRKIVCPKGGEWTLDEKKIESVPSSINELLDKFLSGLDDDTKEVLSKASVLGNDFNIDILKSLYGRNEGELIDALDKLRQEGVLRQSAFADSNILSFMNNVIREGVYSTIRKAELLKMHKRVAELIKDYHKSELSKVYGELKYHLQEAGEEEEIGVAEAGPSAEEIAEKPLSENSAKIAPNIVILLRAAWLNSHLYPLDNKTCIDSIDNLYNDINVVLENDPTLTITASGEDVLLNGEPVSRKKLNIMLARALVSLFSECGISSITFKNGLAKKEMESLFSIFIREEDIEKAGTFAKLLKEKNIANIKVDEVKYRKASALRGGPRMKDSALAKVILDNPILNNLFSVGENGMEVRESAISSIAETITEISKQAIGEKDKITLILEGLSRATAELAKKGADSREKEKQRLADMFLSMEPSLRTKIIEESAAYETEGSNFISDILSTLDEDQVAKVLKEGYRKGRLSPKELTDFIKVALKSQSQKKMQFGDIQNLFKKAGIDKEAIDKAAESAPAEPFFDKMAKDFIVSGKADALESKVINNLRPLTEALTIKGDTKTIEDLAKSLVTKLGSESPTVRASAAEGLEKMLNVLLEKEFFAIATRIIAELSAHLKTEENFKVYVETLKGLEDVISTLIQKQKPSLLINPLRALKEEAAPVSQRASDFKRHVKAAVGRAITPENMNILLLSLRTKTEKDYAAIIELLSQFEEELIVSLIGVLCKKDDMKWDPFDIYMKKQNTAVIIKKMGEEAITKLSALLSDKRPFVALNAAEVFGYINDIRYLPYLESAMLHPDKEVRKTALETIKKLNGGDDVVKILVKVLPREKEPDLVSKIIDVICDLASQQFAPYIKNELKGKIRLDDYDRLVAKLANKK